MPQFDLSMSSHAMSSFLHDFDISKPSPHKHKNLLMRGGEDELDESHFCVESPSGSRSLTSFV